MPARKKPTDDAKPAKAPRKKTVETDAVAAAPPKKAPAKATGAVAKSPRKKTTADAPAAPRKPSGKSLVIVESPAKAKTIQKYLGPGFEVRASYGHVRDLPKRRKKGEEVAGIDIPAGWKPTYVVADKDEGGDGKFKKRRSAKDILAELKKEAQRSDRVFLATDPDREGEAIAWHIEDALNLDDATTFRIAFNEITRTAVQKALATPGKVDMDRVKAQEARRILDRVVGYPLSNLISKKVARALSAGRVQSVALRLVVDREREIEAFKTEEYWKITAVVTPAGSMPNVPAKVEFTVRKKAVDPKAKEEEETPALKVPDGAFPAELAEWAGKKFEAKTEQDALAILGQLPTAAYTVIGIEQKDVQERPQPPFTTSTLQQQANIRLNFTGQRTMRAAQRLYEGVDIGSDGSVALITYMRTDSTRVSEEALRNVREMIDQKYGAPYLPAQANRYASGKSAQEAHEAVRPTDLAYTPQRVEQMLSHSVEHRHDLVKLYTLIYNRFVASQMTPAIFAVTKVDIRAAQGLFKAGGKVLKFDGYRRVLAPKGKQAEAPALPALTVNQKLDLLDLLGSQHFTQPPPRYNEASLIKALEKEGIGRPSTYASIIGKITSDKRGYIEVKERKFFATEIGKVVTDLLVAHFPTVMDLKFTSHMEDELDEIETRKTQYEQVLDGFWGAFSTALRVAEEQMPSKRGVETGEVCPKCGKPLVKNYSKKTGRDFIGCSGFKEGCKYIKPGEGEDERPEPKVTEHKCPKCSQPMVERMSKRGPFLGCSGYPECKMTMNFDAEGKPVPAAVETQHTCEKCGKPMVIRQGKRGPFLACTGYPQCKNAKDVDANGNPMQPIDTGVTCEKCGAAMNVRKGPRGPFLGCSAYPKCRSVKPVPEELKEKLKELMPAPPKAPVVEVSETCPECEGPMALRSGGRRGFFLGCKKFPKCRGTREASPEVLEQVGAT